jgi:hypothetical protein
MTKEITKKMFDQMFDIVKNAPPPPELCIITTTMKIAETFSTGKYGDDLMEFLNISFSDCNEEYIKEIAKEVEKLLKLKAFW